MCTYVESDSQSHFIDSDGLEALYFCHRRFDHVMFNTGQVENINEKTAIHVTQCAFSCTIISDNITYFQGEYAGSSIILVIMMVAAEHRAGSDDVESHF